MISKLVFANLKHRPVRTFLSVCAISIEVTMILTLVGVSRGMLEESQRRARGVGADIWIRPPGTSVISFSSASMPERLIEFFEGQPHVELATGSVTHGIGGVESVSGIDFEKFDRMSGGFRFVRGRPFREPGEIMVDERYAAQNRLKVGSQIQLFNRSWRVCGIVEPGKLARLFLPIHVLQDLAGASGKVSQIYLKLDDPARTAEVIRNLKAQLPGYQIYSIEEFTSLFSVNNVPGLRPFIGVVIILSVVVGFLVVFLSMYTAVLERTREIGILKALGASQGYILGILMRETAIMAAAGAVLGILVTFGTRWLIMTFAGPTLVQKIVVDWWPWTALIALSGALLGTFYPGWKAIRQDVLEALSYE